MKPLERLAAMPWYDLPGYHDSLDTLWSLMRVELEAAGVVGVPMSLARRWSLQDSWVHPGLIVSQCCGPDLTTSAGASLSAFARPVFAHLDCQPGNYFSHIVSTRDHLVAAPRVAVNGTTSYSGCHAMNDWLQKQGVRAASIVVTGSHQGSIAAVLAGTADVAAIDAQTLYLLGERQDLISKTLVLEKLEIIGRTAEAPAPPYVTYVRTDFRAQLIAALDVAITEVGQAVGISDLILTNNADYAGMTPTMAAF